MLGEYVTERDADVLGYLTDVRVTTLTGDDAGSFKLEFAFRENPFFTNTVSGDSPGLGCAFTGGGRLHCCVHWQPSS